MPHTLQIDEERSLHLLTQGEGAPILLLHGAVTTHVDWVGGPLEALSRLGKAITVDRPGHGRSRRPRFAGSPREQARQIGEGLVRIGAEHPIVVGHSFGGLVALALAEQFGPLVRGLVLVAPIAFPEFRPLEQSLYGPRAAPLGGPALAKLAACTTDRPLLASLHRLMFWPRKPDEAWQRRYDWGWMLSAGAGVANGEDALALNPFSPEAWLDFGRIEAATVILAGDKDLVANPALHAARLDAVLARARLELVAGAGHMLHRQHPERVAAAVGALIEAVPE